MQHIYSLTEQSLATLRGRPIAALALGALASLTVISLYQMGRVAHLPDPPLPGFDADRVHRSDDASVLGVPDGLVGMGSYAVTFTLAVMSGPHRPWLSLALGAKVGFDVAQALRLTVREIVGVHALSLWGLLASGATVAMTPLAVPRVWEVWRQIRSGMRT